MRISPKLLATLSLSLLLTACGGTTPEESVQRAQEYLANGEVDAASIELKNALQEDANYADARFLLGTLYQRQGDFASAEKELQRASNLGYPAEEVLPPLAETLLLLGENERLLELPTETLSAGAQGVIMAAQGLSVLSTGELETANKLINDAQSRAPKSPYVGVAMARLLAAEGDLEASQQILEQLLSENDDYVAGWSLLGDLMAAQGDVPAADAAYTKAIDLNPGQLGDRLKRALLRVQQQDFEGASEDIDRLAKAAPQHPGVGYVVGLSQFQQQNYEDAAAALSIASQDKYRYPLSLLYAGTAHFLMGNQDQAKGNADLFHSIQPNNIAGRKLLATIKLNEQDFARVEELIAPVIEATPDDVSALNLMANALLGQGRTDEGIDLLSRVAELEPDSGVAQVRLGAGLLLSGEQSGGVARLEQALKINPEFQQADILIALNFLQQGELDKAIAAANDYRRRNPTEVTPYNLLARIYLEAENQDEAVKAFQKALGLSPGDPAANHGLAELAIKDGNPEAARAFYDAVLEANENFLPTLLKIAELEANLGNNDAMVDRLKMAIDAHPEAVEPRVILARYYLASGRAESVAVLLSGLDEKTRNIPAVLREIAQAQLAQREFVQAEFTLEQELALRPNDPGVHILLASALLGQGKMDRGIEQLDKAIELESKHFGALLTRARVLASLERKEAAEKDVAVLMEIAPENAEVFKLRAALAKQGGDEERALALLQELLELQPITDNMLLVAGQEQELGRDAQALSRKEAWAQENPSDAAALTTVAMAYSELNRVPEAIKQYQRALELDPNNFFALNNLAWSLQDSDPDQALSYAQRAVDVRPGSAEALDTLAVILLQRGDKAGAETNINKALEIMPDHPSMLFHRAEISVANGNKGRARETLRKLVESDAEFPEKQQAATLLDTL